MTTEQAIYYLSAMIDAEGSVKLTYYRHARRSVRIFNTDEDIIDAVIDCLDILGVRFNYYENNYIYDNGKEKRKRVLYEVVISHRDGFEILNEVLDLKSQDKKDELLKIVNSYTTMAYPRTPRAKVPRKPQTKTVMKTRRNG